jgi:hypothetical protein
MSLNKMDAKASQPTLTGSPSRVAALVASPSKRHHDSFDENEAIRPTANDIESGPEPTGSNNFQAHTLRVLNSLISLMADSKEGIQDNPLGGLLAEITLMARDVICCWNRRQLHNVAQESISHRLITTKTLLSKEFAVMKPCLAMHMQLEGGVVSTWSRKWFALKGFALLIHNAKTMPPSTILRFRETVPVAQPVSEGISDPIFFLDTWDGADKKRIRIKASNDIDRQTWLQVKAMCLETSSRCLRLRQQYTHGGVLCI